MKHIYLSGPIDQAKPEHLSFYEQLTDSLIDCGYAVCNPYSESKNLDFSDKNIAKIIYSQDVKAFKSADLFLCYVGFPSSGTGAELAMVINNYKMDVIAYYEQGSKVSYFIKGMLESKKKKIIEISGLNEAGINELLEVI